MIETQPIFNHHHALSNIKYSQNFYIYTFEKVILRSVQWQGQKYET